MVGRKITRMGLLLLVAIAGFPNLMWGQEATEDTTQTGGQSGSGITYVSPVQDFCRAMTVDGQNLWIATSKGLVKMNKITGDQTLMTTADGLPDDNLLDVTKDSNGNLWIGTQSKGVAQWNGAAWKYYTAENSGLHNNQYCTRIAFDATGKAWIGTLGALQSFDGQKWETFTSPRAAMANYWFVDGLKFDTKGQLWMGGSALDWGFAQMEGKTFKVLTKGYAVLALDETKDGTMWLGLKDGIASWKNGLLTKYDNRDYAFSAVRDIKADAEGNLWIASGKELVKMSGGTFTLMATAATTIKCIAPDTDGSLWIGSVGGDVFRYTANQKTLSKWLSGIQDVTASPVTRTECYQMNGVRTSTTAPGLKIVKKTFADGRTEVKKVLVK